jgi:hypothetical protein
MKNRYTKFVEKPQAARPLGDLEANIKMFLKRTVYMIVKLIRLD